LTVVRRRDVVALLILLPILGLLALALRQGFTSRVPGGNDLYPRWAAGCDWIRTGRDPYTPAATLRIQEGMYGRPATSSEDQAAFAYPAFTLVLTWPLCLTQDFATAHAVAMMALLVCVVATAELGRRVTGWRPAPWLWVWTLLWIVLMYPTVRGVLLGQLALVVALLQVGALEALRRRRDALAGAALALSLVKPQMAVLLVPFALLWGGWQRRWPFIVAFAVSLVALVVVPMIWLPSWPASWLDQLRVYTTYTEFGSVAWILTTYYARTPPIVEGVVTIALLFWFVAEAWQARKQTFAPMLWTAALAIVLTHFVSPRTATTHFEPLVVPVFMILRVLQMTNERRTAVFVALGLPVLALLAWTVFLLTVHGRQESALNYLLLPIGLLLGLLWLRRPWRGLTGTAA
jgi:hypothetical protein